jgi:DNA-binding CsgD family transcriptional regulator
MKMVAEWDSDRLKIALMTAFEKDTPERLTCRASQSFDYWSIEITPTLHLVGEVRAIARFRFVPEMAFALSKCQRSILHRLAAGWSPKEIAGEFDVSENTVRTQLRRCAQKIGCESLIHTTLWAKEYLAWT